MFAWQALAVGQNVATALCASFNAVYFLHFLGCRSKETAARRVAAAVLAVLSLGATVESVFFFALVAIWWTALPIAFPWVLVRAFTFVGTASISWLILRRLRSS